MTERSNTEKEMLEGGEICRNFDFEITKKLAQKIGTKKIIFSGNGSSFIFPAKNAKYQSQKYSLTNKVEAILAPDLFQYQDFSDTYVFLASNSGQTKEIMLLLELLQKRGADCVAVTARLDSELAKKCEEKIILGGVFEKGVAATKSVIEQALINESIILHLAFNQGKIINLKNIKNGLNKAGDIIVQNANLPIEKLLIEKLSISQNLFMIGMDTGVAEEITLKAYEIAKKIAVYSPATQILHGSAEAVDNAGVIIFEPEKYTEYINDFQNFSKKTNSLILGIGGNSQLGGLKIGTNEYFNNYCLLAGGWALLRNIANYLRIDIDHPKKIQKVGNPY